MYRSGKRVIGDLRARSERGVRQGIHPTFTPLTLTRRFPDRCDRDPPAVAGRTACPPCGPTCATGCASSAGRPGPSSCGGRGQGIRRPDHGRAVTLHPARAARKEPPPAVEAAREQGAGPTRRLTSGPATEQRPRLPADARSAGAFLSERRENLSERHWARRAREAGTCRKRHPPVRPAVQGPPSGQAGSALTARRFRAPRPQATPSRWTGSPRLRYLSA